MEEGGRVCCTIGRGPRGSLSWLKVAERIVALTLGEPPGVGRKLCAALSV